MPKKMQHSQQAQQTTEHAQHDSFEPPEEGFFLILRDQEWKKIAWELTYSGDWLRCAKIASSDAVNCLFRRAIVDWMTSSALEKRYGS